MRRFLASSIILALGWLIQMPTIHAFNMESVRGEMMKHFTERSIHTGNDGTCTKTEPIKKDCTKSCYEVASVSQTMSHINSVELPGIQIQGTIISTNEPIITVTNSEKLHSTAPPEKATSGRYAALVGIIKRLN